MEGVKLNVEIINTGTELMLGYVVNTHAAWLGARLEELGLRVGRQITVPDGMAIRDALEESTDRASIIIVTGGLGPTSDDMTREITAELFGRNLKEDHKAKEIVTGFFKKWGRPMPEVNLRQAMVPEGAEVLDNPHGTAPGLYLPPAQGNPAIFLLPGPPHELRPMYEAEVLPRLREICGEAGIDIPAYKVFKTSGIGESLADEKVDHLLTVIPHLEVGYCAHPGAVDIRLIGTSEAVRKGGDIIRAELKEYLVNDEGLSLEETLVRLLAGKGKKIATAESCTGGLIAGRVTDVPGSSDVFEYGWVTYANKAKTAELGVFECLLDTHGAVSREVAEAMAEGALCASGADLAVAVTGVAGPGGGTEDKPVGTVWIAWATGEGVVSRKEFFPTGRKSFRERVVQSALRGVFLWLTSPELFKTGKW